MPSAEIVVIILLALHITFIALWAGAAALMSSIIVPSLGKISAGSRAEFVVTALPRILRFVVGTATGAIIVGVLLFGYETRFSSGYAPSALGTTFIEAGALVGLVAYVLAIGVAYPTSVRLVKALQSPKDTDKSSPSMDIPRLQLRMRASSGAIAGLLALTLILMVIGATA